MTLHHFKNILKPLLITIFLLALYKLGSHITPLYFFNSETASMPLFHLGLSPAIIGFIFIEVLFMTPIFKKIKKKGEKRHSLKNKLSLGLSFLLATISACFLTRTIEHVRTASGDLIISDPNLVTFIFLTACYVLGFGLILLIGHLITRFGLMNGYCALFLFNHLIVLKNNTLQYYKDLVVKNLSPNFFGIALFIFISWFLYKSFTKTTHVFYKKSISLKMPFFIQGIIPFILSGSSGFILLSFLQESFNFNISLNLPRYGSWEYCGYTVLLTFTMGILLSLFLIRPKKIAHSLNIQGPLSFKIFLPSLLKNTFFITVLSFVFSYPLPEKQTMLIPPLMDPIYLIMLTTLIVDLSKEILFKAKNKDFVCVQELDNVYKATQLKGNLDQQGIPSTIQGYHYRSLFHSFLPLVKMRVLIPKKDLEHYRKIKKVS